MCTLLKMGHYYNQGRIEPPKAARGHATSNSANIDSIVLNVTKNRGLVLRVRPPIL